jgi:hypothetical protein
MAKSRKRPRGIFTLYSIVNGIWTPTVTGPNARMHTAGWIIAQALRKPNSGFWLNAMYIEFENVANAEDDVTTPTIDPAEGVEYYTGLDGSGDRDYLRIAIEREPSVSIAAGFEDSFAEGQGNVVKFFAQTSGTEGVNGAEFSDAVNSKICGVAIVAAPDWGDPTQDVIYARKYYSAEQQRVKEANGQIGLSYTAPLYDV